MVGVLLLLLVLAGQVADATRLARRGPANAQGVLPNGVRVVAPAPPSDFCKGQPQLRPSDGTQITTGACSSTPQGAIPTVDRMVSTIIVSPASGSTVDPAKDLLVSIRTDNLVTGFFNLAATQYYLSPQTLDASGTIQGHQHITIQAIGDGSRPPNAKVFAFFKGLNDPAQGGLLSVTVPAGTLQPGVHRICSITGTDSHQPVIMPVAQRGSQDDCIRITVAASGSGGGGDAGKGTGPGAKGKQGKKQGGK